MITKEEIAALMDVVGEAIKRYVSKATGDLSSQFDEKIKALPQPASGKDGRDGEPGRDGKDGQNGSDGKSVTAEDVLPTVKGWFDELPRPVDGKDGKDGKDGTDGKSVTLDDVRPIIVAAVADLPKPKDGIDGKSVSADDVLPTVRQWFDELPRPTNGKDGVDGKSVTLEDVRELHESLFAKWQLDWERRAMEVNQRCLDRFEKPKDGKDGLDGLGFDDLTPSFDGRRTFTMRWTRGEQVKEFSFKVPALIESGVWIHGKEYEQGDGVTCGGNYWIALTDTKARPGENNSDWRLAVRKGRDGKDAR
jgi:hypothetical protein